MKFSLFGFFNKSSKKSSAKDNDSAGENGGSDEPGNAGSNDKGLKIDGAEAAPSKNKNFSELLRKMIIVSVFFIILLLGVVAGLLIFRQQGRPSRIMEDEPFTETASERMTEARYDALDPVSGDWGITADEFVSRVNVTLEKVGVRSGRIVNLRVSGNEFRHSFSRALLLSGELSDIKNVRRAAVFFDPALDQLDIPLAMAAIRALISAVDPSLTREDILNMMNSLEISSDTNVPQRRGYLRHKKFVFRVWSVAGSAFVFTVSSDY